MVYVIDASALIAIEGVCARLGHSYDVVIARLTDLSTSGGLTYPPLVVRDCREYGETDVITSWVRSNAPHLDNNAPGYDLIGGVIAQCPDLIDLDDQRESAELEVLALAVSRGGAGGVSVTVVTEQWTDSPIKQSLGSAALSLGFQVLSTEQFVVGVMTGRAG